jgi:hypothetical protein
VKERLISSQKSIEELSIFQMTFPTRWRLSSPGDAASKQLEEVVLRIQGIVTVKELPPLGKDK